MCFRIVCQQIPQNRENEPKKSYKLMYLPGAKSVTDPPAKFWLLLAQRRRWINGGNAAFIEVITHYEEFSNSNHTWYQKTLYLVNIFF